MEGTNFLTAGDLALIENHRNPYNYGGCGYGYGYGECGHGYRNGAATTGIGLAAGLGGGALLLAIAGIWGVNQASKARAKGAEQGIAIVNNNIERLANLQVAETQNRQAAIQYERASREGWQNVHAPSTTQYVDVRTASLSGAGSNALAQAEAQIVSNALTGVTQRCPTPVALYSAPQPCSCPGSCG